MNIKFEGDCTIQRSEELLDTLRQAVTEGTEALTLSFSDVESVDLSFFQLIEALRRTCRSSDRELVLQRDLPPELAPHARRTGFAEIVPEDAPTPGSVQGAR